MELPKHSCGLYLEHNSHKDVYETAEQKILEAEARGDFLADWATPESREECIKNNELWELQWYPNTPVGFNLVWGATLEEVLSAANRINS